MSRGTWVVNRYRAEELEFMLDMHQPLCEVLPRIGITSVDALLRWLHRNGRADLIRRLHEREPWISRELGRARRHCVEVAA